MARKFGVTQGEIVRYLTGKNIRVEEGSNVKLGESQIRLLYAHFAPGESFEDRSSPPEGTSVVPLNATPSPTALSMMPISDVASLPSDEIVTIDSQSSFPGESNVAVMPEEQPAPLPSDASSASQSETIRASKIELAGLRVVGKIELPEPRKKDVSQPLPEGSVEPLVDETVLPAEQPKSSEASQPIKELTGVDRPRRKMEDRRRGDERGPRRNQGRDQRPGGNPIAAQREREQQEELERRKEKAAQDKERKTQNYNKRVKHSPPTKAMRLVEEPVEELNADALGDEPKTWLGKLIKWLRF